MVQINFASREVNCKLVYYGPGRCGKTTNLQIVHQNAPPNSKGDLVSIATETDRTLYFDFLPLDLGMVAGMRTKFQLYTVPGQVYYDATRKLVLQGCDGVVFVADSNPDIMAENIESLDNLAKNLRENGLDLEEIPLVLQFNKRDLPNAVPVEEINAKLNRRNWPTVNAVAINGEGVFQTLKIISQQVIKGLNRQYDDSKRKPPGVASGAGKAPVAPPPPPPPVAGGRVSPPVAAPPPPAAPRVVPPPPAPPVAVAHGNDAVAPAQAEPPPKPPPPPAAGEAATARESVPGRRPSARTVAPPPPLTPPSPQGGEGGVRGQEHLKPAAGGQFGPPGDGSLLSRTDVFKKRMKEIREEKAQAGAKQGQAARSEAPQAGAGQAPQAGQQAAPEPKKKGCFGMLMLAAGMLLAVGVALVHWLK